jgi:hypothetical protein
MIAAVSRNENSTYSQFLRGKVVPAQGGACVCAPAAALRVQHLGVVLIAIVFTLGV